MSLPPMKRILLVHPPCLEERVNAEDAASVPIGLFFIGALLREKGHVVEVLNGQRHREQPERLRSIVEAFQADLIGFSVLQANRWGAIDMARWVKAARPEVVTVFGGVSASLLWRHFLTHFAEIDYVVIGEGERPMLHLIQWLEAGGDPDGLKGIRGLAHRQDGVPVRTECPEPLADLDALPNPGRHFTYPHVTLSRGCPSNCRFCGSPEFWGRRVRFHSAAYFADQIEALNRKGITFFYVSDDTFTLNRNRAIEACRELIRRKIRASWAAISRVDAVDGEVLAWMRRAGCIQISYGVESGSPAIRSLLGKDIPDDRIAAAFAETVGYGLLPRAYFIYGCPGESPETIGQTLDLIRRIRPLAAVFYILDLFPGTGLYRDFRRRTGATDDIWLERIEDIPYFETDPDLSREMVLDHGRRLRTGFLRMLPDLVEGIPLIDSPEFRPLHADFLSRLAMTFHRGDYAGVPEIPDAAGIARRLYDQALGYHPDPRAYLGLGMLDQELGRFAEAGAWLEQGLQAFPEDTELAICLAVCHMNTGRFDAALERLLALGENARTRQLVAECRRQLRSGN
ncbi:MAG: radical SAM protein [Desulfobacterales bacterium]